MRRIAGIDVGKDAQEYVILSNGASIFRLTAWEALQLSKALKEQAEELGVTEEES